MARSTVGEPLAPVHHQHHRGGLVDGELGLLLHAAHERPVGDSSLRAGETGSKPPVSTRGEQPALPGEVAVVPVPGDAGHVLRRWRRAAPRSG